MEVVFATAAHIAQDVPTSVGLIANKRCVFCKFGLIGKVSALHVGWRWNGYYTLVSGLLLSAWVLLAAYLLA